MSVTGVVYFRCISVTGTYMYCIFMVIVYLLVTCILCIAISYMYCILGQYDNYPSLLRHNALNNSIGNPRLPPYPHPITVFPLAQIKQPLMAGRGSSKTGSPSHTASDNWILVTACFSTPRVWVGGTPSLAVEKRGRYS